VPQALNGAGRWWNLERRMCGPRSPRGRAEFHNRKRPCARLAGAGADARERASAAPTSCCGAGPSGQRGSVDQRAIEQMLIGGRRAAAPSEPGPDRSRPKRFRRLPCRCAPEPPAPGALRARQARRFRHRFRRTVMKPALLHLHRFQEPHYVVTLTLAVVCEQVLH
jgi:hypothetical protein